MNDHDPAPERGRWTATLVGVTAAALGVGLGEFVAGLDHRWRSVVLAAGDAVIDLAPGSVERTAVRTVGKSDKPLLIAGVLLVVLLAGGVVGRSTARTGARPAIIGVGVFAFLGSWASVAQRPAGTNAALAVLPALLAGITALVTLLVLLVRSNSPKELPAEGSPLTRTMTPDRRLLLVSGVGLGGAALMGGVGRWMQTRTRVRLARSAVSLPPPDVTLPPATAGAELAVPGISPLFTPNSAFYRIDTALLPPTVDPDAWALRVNGRVRTPLRFTYAELLERPLIEVDATIACVSNEVGGDLVGTARWLGCRLDDLLDEAGIDPSADEVFATSVDGWTCGFPTSVLDGRDAIVAVGMNGEPLPINHGFPARLIVPGIYGYVSACKWLSEIRLTRFADDQGYWVPLGWAERAPVKTQSRIDTPVAGTGLRPGRVPIAGVAWAPIRGIERVEVLVTRNQDLRDREGTEGWVAATLSEPVNGSTWRQWVHQWDATPGRWYVSVRATDATGATQTPERSDVAPDGATGWHTIRVDVR